MVFPGRGRIRVDADSVHRISTWCKMIQDVGGRTDDAFFMAWLAVAFSTFLAPTTALKLSPKCYGLVLDHEILKNTNIFLLVVEHINEAFQNMDQEKQTVCSCLYHLMVIKKDTISPGVFGKLQLKEEYRGTEQTPLFGGILQAEAFVASKLPITYNPQKKAKIAKVVNDMCKAVTEQVGTFIEAVAKIDDEEPDIDPYVQRPSMGTGMACRAPKRKRRGSTIQEEEEFVEEE
ncbi:hypothetical protein VPH35_084046 [Triticum aestivum]